jgi:AcrR family transcriptional regulator
MALVEAAIDLFQAGNPEPSSRELAEQAQVSVRTVFKHYRIDALYGAAAAAQVGRSLSSIIPLPPRGPLATRIGATGHQRRQMFESMGRVLYAVQLRPSTAAVVSDALEEVATLLRSQIDFTFGPEITRHPDRAHLITLLDLVTGWESWSSMRFRRQMSAATAERFLVSYMTELLS